MFFADHGYDHDKYCRLLRHRGNSGPPSPYEASHTAPAWAPSAGSSSGRSPGCTVPPPSHPLRTTRRHPRSVPRTRGLPDHPPTRPEALSGSVTRTKYGRNEPSWIDYLRCGNCLTSSSCMGVGRKMVEGDSLLGQCGDRIAEVFRDPEHLLAPAQAEFQREILHRMSAARRTVLGAHPRLRGRPVRQRLPAPHSGYFSAAARAASSRSTANRWASASSRAFFGLQRPAITKTKGRNSTWPPTQIHHQLRHSPGPSFDAFWTWGPYCRNNLS